MDDNDARPLAGVTTVAFIPSPSTWLCSRSGIPNTTRLKDTPALPRAAVLGCGGGGSIMAAEGLAMMAGAVDPDGEHSSTSGSTYCTTVFAY